MVMCILQLVVCLLACVLMIIVITTGATQDPNVLFLIVIPAIAAVISIIVFLSYYQMAAVRKQMVLQYPHMFGNNQGYSQV